MAIKTVPTFVRVEGTEPEKVLVLNKTKKYTHIQNVDGGRIRRIKTAYFEQGFRNTKKKGVEVDLPFDFAA